MWHKVRSHLKCKNDSSPHPTAEVMGFCSDFFPFIKLIAPSLQWLKFWDRGNFKNSVVLNGNEGDPWIKSLTHCTHWIKELETSLGVTQVHSSQYKMNKTEIPKQWSELVKGMLQVHDRVNVLTCTFCFLVQRFLSSYCMLLLMWNGKGRFIRRLASVLGPLLGL